MPCQGTQTQKLEFLQPEEFIYNHSYHLRLKFQKLESESVTTDSLKWEPECVQQVPENENRNMLQEFRYTVI